MYTNWTAWRDGFGNWIYTLTVLFPTQKISRSFAVSPEMARYQNEYRLEIKKAEIAELLYHEIRMGIVCEMWKKALDPGERNMV